MRKNLTLILFLFFIVNFSISASSYVISDYDFHIVGRTKESALRRLIANDEGTVFDNLEELNAAIEDKTQTLLAKRLFQDVKLWWTESGSDQDTIYVIIHTQLRSTISAYVSPGGTYDSNTGLRFLLSGVDQNFLGSMEESSILFDFRQQDGTFEDTVFQVCAKAGGHFQSSDFHVHFDLFKYSKETEKDNVFLGIQTKGRKISSSFGVRLYLEDSAYRFSKGMKDEDQILGALGFQATEDISLRMEFNTTIPISSNRNHSLLALAAAYSFERLLGFDLIAQVSTNLKWKEHSYQEAVNKVLVTAKIQDIKWSEDFRSGYDLDVSLEVKDNGEFELKTSAACFKRILSWMNFHGKATCRISNFADPESGLDFTKKLRGIKDDNSIIRNGDFNNAFVLNASLFCQVLTVDWLGSLYVNPFIDMALFSKNETTFIGGVGCELIAVLDQWPGLPFRFSYGHSLTDPQEWEFTINAYFFY